MPYVIQDQRAGYVPIEGFIPAAAAAAAIAAGFTPSPGSIVAAFDKVWGGGEFIWARAGTTIPLLQLCLFTPVWDAPSRTYIWNAAPVGNTANLGRTVGVCKAEIALAAGDYAWFQISGNTPISGTATVAADTTFGITAAGQVGANSAGKQILNARVLTAATQTVIKVGTGLAGDNLINVPDTDGWFVGGFLSGTGVGAATIIREIDPLGKFVRVTVNNSAAIAGNVTLTYNNAVIFYNVANLNRPFAQGAIT
jgi:hypothetical protein